MIRDNFKLIHDGINNIDRLYYGELLVIEKPEITTDDILITVNEINNRNEPPLYDLIIDSSYIYDMIADLYPDSSPVIVEAISNNMICNSSFLKQVNRYPYSIKRDLDNFMRPIINDFYKSYIAAGITQKIIEQSRNEFCSSNFNERKDE